MQPIIAVDARDVFAHQRRGTGKNLLDAYRSIARRQPHWRFVLYHRLPNGDSPFVDLSNISDRAIDMPGDRFDLWEEIRLPSAARKDGATLLHCPANSCPRFSRVPVVSTIHDLIPLKVMDPLHNGYARLFRSRIRRCLKKSLRVIAVSESTKKDLISDFGVAPERVDVLTWAPDSAYVRTQDEALLACVRSRYNIDARYLLAFAGRSRRKNASGMIQGFARVSAAGREDVQFVIVGVEPEAQRARLRGLIQDLGLVGRCQVFGFVPEHDVAPLLSAAEGLAFCSLYEGFGLPILDAFRCNTAVLTSNVSSMPEVAGDAALYCDPAEPLSIAEGMTRLICDSALRRDLVGRGNERVRQFTWERTAETICRVFEKCFEAQRQR